MNDKTSLLEQLASLNEHRDRILAQATSDIIAMIEPTVGAAIDLMFDEAGNAVEYDISDVLIYDEALVAVIDLEVLDSSKLLNHSLLGALIQSSPEKTLGDSYYTSMHLSIPVEMAFDTPQEIVKFVSEQKVVHNMFDSDGTLIESNEMSQDKLQDFDDGVLTEEQQLLLMPTPKQIQ